jgi:hypothetical protein
LNLKSQNSTDSTKTKKYFVDEIGLNINTYFKSTSDNYLHNSFGVQFSDYLIYDAKATIFHKLGYSHALVFNPEGIENTFNFSTGSQARFHFGIRKSWFSNVGWFFDYYPLHRSGNNGVILGGGKKIEFKNRTYALNANGMLGHFNTFIPNGTSDIYFQIGVKTILNKLEVKQPQPNDDYWSNTDAIFMDDLDSAEIHLKKNHQEKIAYRRGKIIEEEKIARQKRKIEREEKRNTAKKVKEKSKAKAPRDTSNGIRKNNVRFEIVGISGIAGLVYARNIYRNKFDFNLRAGILPFPYGIPSLNLGAVFTTNKYHINPIGIVSVTTLGGDDFNDIDPVVMISLGATFQFTKRWSVQIY